MPHSETQVRLESLTYREQATVGRLVLVIGGEHVGLRGAVVFRSGDLLHVRVSPPAAGPWTIAASMDEIKFID